MSDFQFSYVCVLRWTLSNAKQLPHFYRLHHCINLMVLTESKIEQYNKYFNVCHFLIIDIKLCRIAGCCCCMDTLESSSATFFFRCHPVADGTIILC